MIAGPGMMVNALAVTISLPVPVGLPPETRIDSGSLTMLAQGTFGVVTVTVRPPV